MDQLALLWFTHIPYDAADLPAQVFMARDLDHLLSIVERAPRGVDLVQLCGGAGRPGTIAARRM